MRLRTLRRPLATTRQAPDTDPVQAAKRFSGPCREQLREEIAEAGGNEVFALGYLDDQGLVARLVVRARGNKDSVLALDSGPEPADVTIHNHPSGFLVPSDEDLVIAGRAAEDGTGFFIVDNQVSQVYVVAEPVKRRKRTALDASAVCAELEEGGAIAGRLEQYESRPSQLDLMRLVIRGFNEDRVVAAEAGTGVGKSFAYLLPAMRYALDNDERIVISTATINLQQQLYDKDIPLVNGALDKKIKAVLIKGRGNYLCRRRLEDALRETDMFDDQRDALERIIAWTETTASGSRSDLSFLPPETLWSRICSEADLCMGLRCPDRERCFVLALRKEAADARILVVNHHLLFADLAARAEGAGYDSPVVLPPYTRVIMDEAHTMEGAATSFFSKEFSRLGLYRQLGRLYRRRRAMAAPQGLLVALADLSRQGDRLEEGAKLVEKARNAADDLNEAALHWSRIDGSGGSFRLAPADGDGAAAALTPLLLELRKKIIALTGLVRNMLETLPEDSVGDPAVWEIKAIARRLDAIAAVCVSFIEYRERPDEVMWVERHAGRGGGDSAGGDWAVFSVTPIDVAPSLRTALFEPNKTVICVSATLTVNGSFAYWENRCGLKPLNGKEPGDPGGEEALTGQFPSPFPYARAVLLAVPRDAPLPEQQDYRAFVDRAAAELAETAGGSALILFTSYESLRSAFAAAAPRLETLGIHCLKQGDDDRSRLLKAFLEDQSSVLFATHSFWEGVDAPGDTLRLVVLCRLPFRAPNEPVFRARCEALDKKGGSSFMELSLPEAVMKFKQGFGRLMRRSSDHGVVAVLDGRLLHKHYGKYFLQSIPETRTNFSGFNSLIQRMEEFLFSPEKR